VYNLISLFPHSSLYTLRRRPKGCFPKPFIVRTLSLSNKIYTHTHNIYIACVYFFYPLYKGPERMVTHKYIRSTAHSRVVLYTLYRFPENAKYKLYTEHCSGNLWLSWEWFPSDCQCRGMITAKCNALSIYFPFLEQWCSQFGIIVSGAHFVRSGNSFGFL